MRLHVKSYVKIYHFFLCAFFLISCQSEELLREHFQSLKGRDELTFIVFGDSISGARGFSETGTSYGSFMKPMLAELLDSRISMIHACKQDDTYKTALRRIQEDILSYRPDVVFVMLGFADASTWGLIEPIFKKQVANFLEELQNRNVFVIVLTTPAFRDIESKNDAGLNRIKEFNGLITYSAALHNYPSIDVLTHLEKIWKTDKDEYRSMFSDSIHLNEKGQKYVAEYIVKRISDAMEKPDNKKQTMQP